MDIEELKKEFNRRLDEQLKEELKYEKQLEINAAIKELKTLVEKLKNEELEQTEKIPLGWIPEEGEYYFYVNIYGNIEATTNDKTRIDRNLIKHTRVFKTKEEAKFEAERMKVLRELEKFACEFKYDFGLYIGGYSIFYDYRLNQLFVDDALVKRHELYFESRKKAKEAIEAVGEDRVKKYYLGVKDN